MRYQPERILAFLSSNVKEEDPDLQRAGRCYQGLIAHWCRLQNEPEPVPVSVDALRSTFYLPYQRMKTVIWENREWDVCMQTYDDPRTIQIIEPPWPDDAWDLFAALALRLFYARSRWIVSIPNMPQLKSLFLPLIHPRLVCEEWQAGRVLFMNFNE